MYELEILPLPEVGLGGQPLYERRALVFCHNTDLLKMKYVLSIRIITEIVSGDSWCFTIFNKICNENKWYMV